MYSLYHCVNVWTTISYMVSKWYQSKPVIEKESLYEHEVEKMERKYELEFMKGVILNEMVHLFRDNSSLQEEDT